MDSQFPVEPKLLCVAMMEAAPDAILLIDVEGRIAVANRQAEELFGYRRDELVGMSVDRLVPQAARSRHRKHRAAYMKTPAPRPIGQVGRLTAQTKDGSIVPVSIALSPLRTGEQRYVMCSVRDETASRRLEDELRRRSTTDELTGVYNRAFFEAELTRLEGGRRLPVSVIVADVDGLKPINDLHGHAAGDTLLRRTAAVLRTAFRSDDVVARIGGDEFAILLPEVNAAGLSEALVRLHDDLARHNDVSRGPTLHLSYGGATVEDPSNLRAALREADVRMYEHKRRHGHGSRPPATTESSAIFRKG